VAIVTGVSYCTASLLKSVQASLTMAPASVFEASSQPLSGVVLSISTTLQAYEDGAQARRIWRTSPVSIRNSRCGHWPSQRGGWEIGGTSVLSVVASPTARCVDASAGEWIPHQRTGPIWKRRHFEDAPLGPTGESFFRRHPSATRHPFQERGIE